MSTFRTISDMEEELNPGGHEYIFTERDVSHWVAAGDKNVIAVNFGTGADGGYIRADVYQEYIGHEN